MDENIIVLFCTSRLSGVILVRGKCELNKEFKLFSKTKES